MAQLCRNMQQQYNMEQYNKLNNCAFVGLLYKIKKKIEKCWRRPFNLAVCTVHFVEFYYICPTNAKYIFTIPI